MKQVVTLTMILISLFSHAQDSLRKNIDIEYEQYKKMQAVKYAGKPFGQFMVKKSGQTIFSNENLSGKIVFVNFWFETCAPCMAEVDGLNKMYDTLKNKTDFLFLSFSFDPDSTIEQLKNKLHLPYQVFHIDRPECYRLNFNNGFPASFILDRKGNIQYFKAGGQIDKEKASAEVMKEIYPKILEQLLN